MKRTFSLILLLLSCSTAAFSIEPRTTNPLPVMQTVRQAGESRIISLKPNITEILFALGAGDNVVGVTTWCDYPKAVKRLPKAADYININTERIIALKPDIVIGSQENSVKGQFAALNSAGIRTMTVPFATLYDLYNSIGKIAEAVGKTNEGKKIVDRLQKSLQVCKSASRQVCKSFCKFDLPTCRPADLRTVLLLVGRRPLVAASDKTFISEVMGLAGFKNIVTSEKLYPTINTEFLLAKNPDVIIDLGMGSEADGELPPALRGRVVKLDISDFRAGPRVGEVVKKLSVIPVKAGLSGK